MSTDRRSILGLAAAFALALLACGGNEESAPDSAAMTPSQKPSAPAATSSEPRGTEKVRKAEISRANELPRDFPADIPTYPGARSKGGLAVPGASSLIAFQTYDDPKKVYGFYRESLQENGWSIEEESEDQSRLAVRKGSRTTLVTVQRTQNLTLIGIMIQADDETTRAGS